MLWFGPVGLVCYKSVGFWGISGSVNSGFFYFNLVAVLVSTVYFDPVVVIQTCLIQFSLFTFDCVFLVCSVYSSSIWIFVVSSASTFI